MFYFHYKSGSYNIYDLYSPRFTENYLVLSSNTYGTPVYTWNTM